MTRCALLNPLFLCVAIVSAASVVGACSVPRLDPYDDSAGDSQPRCVDGVCDGGGVDTTDAGGTAERETGMAKGDWERWQRGNSSFGDPMDWGFDNDPPAAVLSDSAFPGFGVPGSGLLGFGLPQQSVYNTFSPCPPEMVHIPTENPYCIDRWEATVQDKVRRRTLSPHYSPTPQYAKKAYEVWSTKRLTVGDQEARQMALPPLPSWQLEGKIVPVAVSLPGQIPQGYVSGLLAREACNNAGKRLCTRAEWVRACRGAANQPFPYGSTYRRGVCNVHRQSHPAAVLHRDPSTGHLDPRLNLVQDEQGPLLRRTGSLEECASKWGNDAVYDMVGNLDEWIDDDKGVFLGGFFSRNRKDGCAASISSHPNQYFDYSLGIRCCREVQRR